MYNTGEEYKTGQIMTWKWIIIINSDLAQSQQTFWAYYFDKYQQMIWFCFDIERIYNSHYGNGVPAMFTS